MSVFIDILIGKRELPDTAIIPPLLVGRYTLDDVLQQFVSDSGSVDYVGLREDIDFIRLVEVVSDCIRSRTQISLPPKVPH